MKSKNELNAQSYKLLEHHKLINILAKCEVVEEHIKKIEYPEERIEELRRELMEKLGVNNSEEFRKKLLEQNIKEEEYYENNKKTEGLKQMAINMFKEKAKTKFLENKHKYDIASYSLIRVKNAYQARELLLRINEGEESFEDLATKYSEGPERYNRGVIGPAPIEKASAELAKIVRGSRKGETRGPFQIGEWAVILRLNNLTLAKYDSGMEERICTELFEDYINNETKKTIEDLKRIFELNQSTPE